METKEGVKPSLEQTCFLNVDDIPSEERDKMDETNQNAYYFCTDEISELTNELKEVRKETKNDEWCPNPCSSKLSCLISDTKYVIDCCNDYLTVEKEGLNERMIKFIEDNKLYLEETLKHLEEAHMYEKKTRQRKCQMRLLEGGVTFIGAVLVAVAIKLSYVI